MILSAITRSLICQEIQGGLANYNLATKLAQQQDRTELDRQTSVRLKRWRQ